MEDHQGKIMSVNDGDVDGDGIPDFADGYSLPDAPPDGASLMGVSFIPYILDLSGVKFFEETRVGVLYFASNPNGVTRSGSGTASDPYVYTPALHSLRLWTKNAHERIAGSGIVPGNSLHQNGYFVQPFLQYTIEDFRDAGAEEISPNVFRLWIEAVRPAFAPAGAMISILADPDGPQGGAGFMLADAVRVTPLGVDIDVDSDRTNGLNLPDRSVFEEQLELAPFQIGKLLATNDDDRDGDGIPDYADGFDWDGVAGNADDTPPNPAQGGGFVPVVLEIPTSLDLTKARFRFDYNESDPADVSRTGSGTLTDPYVFSPGPGDLRLWTKNGTSWRKKADIRSNGDFVAPLGSEDSYAPEYWTTIGISSTTRTATLWLEAIAVSEAKGDMPLTFKIDPDGNAGPIGFVAMDTVKLTAIDVDILIGADNANDDSLKDDWVAARDGTQRHTIYNWLRLRGPVGLEQQLTVDSSTDPGGSGTIALQGYHYVTGEPLPEGPITGTLEIQASGLDTGEFLIKGDNVSSAPNDVVVTATFNSQVFGSETLTVLRFNYEEEVGSEARIPATGMTDGNYVINPAVRRNTRQVFGFDVGNSAVTDFRKHDATYLAGTTPPLNSVSSGQPLSTKFGAQNIEITFGRRIQGASAGSGLEKLSTDGSTPVSQLAIAPEGVNGSLFKSNLRITDDATTGTGIDGNQYVYYLGRPTEKLPQVSDVDENFAKNVTVITKADLTYIMNIVLLQYQPAAGPLQTTGLCPADVQRLVMEASSLWEQVGVRFIWGGTTVVTTTVATEWDLPNDNVPTLTAVTTKSRANGLDIFIVNSINSSGGFLSGAAAYYHRRDLFPPAQVDWRETGVIVSRRKTGPTSALEDISEIARTIAHETGHLIYASGSHDNAPRNLMRAGSTGSTNNADLRLNQRDSIEYGPSVYNSDED